MNPAVAICFRLPVHTETRDFLRALLSDGRISEARKATINPVYNFREASWCFQVNKLKIKQNICLQYSSLVTQAYETCDKCTRKRRKRATSQQYQQQTSQISQVSLPRFQEYSERIM